MPCAITTGEWPDIVANIDRQSRFYECWPLSSHDDVPVARDSGVICVIKAIRKFFFAASLLRIASSIEVKVVSGRINHSFRACRPQIECWKISFVRHIEHRLVRVALIESLILGNGQPWVAFF